MAKYLGGMTIKSFRSLYDTMDWDMAGALHALQKGTHFTLFKDARLKLNFVY